MIFLVFFGSILLAHCAAGGGWSSYSVRSSTRGGRRGTERGAEKPNWRSMAATAPRFFLQVVSLLSLFVSFAKWTSEIHWFAKKKKKLKLPAWSTRVCAFLFHASHVLADDVKKYPPRSWIIIQNEILCDNCVNFSPSRAEFVYSLGCWFYLSR